MSNVAELMGELIDLNEVEKAPAPRKLVQKKPGLKRGTVGIADMSEEERREYNAEKAREHQARLAREREAGDVPLNAKYMREALADAAIAIIATGANGAAELEKVLAAIYQTKPAAVSKVKADIKRGKLKAKLLTSK